MLSLSIEPSTAAAEIVKAPALRVASPLTVVQDGSPFASATRSLPLPPAAKAAGSPEASP